MEIQKLPKWAQEYIARTESERRAAVRLLDEYLDQQTPSAFLTEDMECTGEAKGPTLRKRYIQARKIECCAGGVELTVMVRQDHEREYIELRWENSRSSEIAFIPDNFQGARLVAREAMR